jgi:hypothetical protein
LFVERSRYGRKWHRSLMEGTKELRKINSAIKSIVSRTEYTARHPNTMFPSLISIASFARAQRPGLRIAKPTPYRGVGGSQVIHQNSGTISISEKPRYNLRKTHSAVEISVGKEEETSKTREKPSQPLADLLLLRVSLTRGHD